jgi:hypothetical protein
MQTFTISRKVKKLNIMMDLGEAAPSNAKYINCFKFIYN